VTPYLLYEDVDAALDWLVAAFGFAERVRMPGPDGRCVHGEVGFNDGVVMMGYPGPDYQNPKHRGRATQLVYVYVDDLDKHYAVAKAAGAEILRNRAISSTVTVPTVPRTPKATTGHSLSMYAM
jgi:uncharacterized glyoxalase superfamily protein PhnB